MRRIREVTITSKASAERMASLGFEPAGRMKTAGCIRDWQHTDGRKGVVAYSLGGASGQRSGMTDWRFTILYDAA